MIFSLAVISIVALFFSPHVDVAFEALNPISKAHMPDHNINRALVISPATEVASEMLVTIKADLEHDIHKNGNQTHRHVSQSNISSSNSNNSNSEPLDPVQQLTPVRILNEYIQRHSDQAMRTNNHGRKYTVAYYSCPMHAGNRLFHFFNTIVWSVVTNRTVLWKYYDNATCTALGDLVYGCNQEGGSFVCCGSNTVKNCDSIVHRASWLQSYDTWVEQLPQLDHVEFLHYWSVRPRRGVTWFEIAECPWNDTFANVSGVPSWDNKTVVRFPRMGYGNVLDQ
jgi:hypothetical protein